MFLRSQHERGCKQYIVSKYNVHVCSYIFNSFYFTFLNVHFFLQYIVHNNEHYLFIYSFFVLKVFEKKPIFYWQYKYQSCGHVHYTIPIIKFMFQCTYWQNLTKGILIFVIVLYLTILHVIQTVYCIGILRYIILCMFI